MPTLSMSKHTRFGFKVDQRLNFVYDDVDGLDIATCASRQDPAHSPTPRVARQCLPEVDSSIIRAAAMPPAPVRTPNKRTVSALPETSRLNFLLAASQLFAQTCPEASSQMGSQALKVEAASSHFSGAAVCFSVCRLTLPVFCSGLILSVLPCPEGQQVNCAINVEPTAGQRQHTWSRLHPKSASGEGKPRRACRTSETHATLQAKALSYVITCTSSIASECRSSEHKVAAVCLCQVSAKLYLQCLSAVHSWQACKHCICVQVCGGSFVQPFVNEDAAHKVYAD